MAPIQQANQFNALFGASLIAAFAGAVLLAFACMAAEPPFDREKANALSPEKRRQYDVVFFNEIVMWNENSNRYRQDGFKERKAEFQRMAADGYLPAYVALRLTNITSGTTTHDPEALQMLLRAAADGDLSATCAVGVIPTEEGLWPERVRLETSLKMMIAGADKGHLACKARYGGSKLLGVFEEIPVDRAAAMPMLLESAQAGYYIAIKSLFSLRQRQVFKGQFDFSDNAELQRALCWGRLGEQQTNWTGFTYFLEKLRGYARAKNNPGLMAEALRLDPKRVPITQQAVTPTDCIQLETGR